MGRPKVFNNIKESFYNKFIKLPNGCWKWTAKIHKITGYGNIGYNEKHYLAHRVSYLIHKGDIPKNLVIDHICNNRYCVNPNHLQAITLRENILKGNSPFAINKRKTHCKNGHSLFGDNLYICPKGKRGCRICRTNAVKRFQNK